MKYHKNRLPFIDREFRLEIDEILDQTDNPSELYDKENIKAYFEDSVWSFDDDEDHFEIWCEICDEVIQEEYFIKEKPWVRRDLEDSARAIMGVARQLDAFVRMADVYRSREHSVSEEERADWYYEWYFEVDELLREILYK